MWRVLLALAGVLLLQAYNAVLLHAGWPFALAVVFELAMAFFMFVRLLQQLRERPSA